MPMRALCGWLFVFSLLAAAGCARESVPTIPSGELISHELLPKAFRLVPFYSFPGGRYGEQPVAGLVGDGKGDLYGVTSSGGRSACLKTSSFAAGCGVIYELRKGAGTSFMHSVVFNFTRAGGARPTAPMSANASGTFAFGTTSAGGAYGLGTVYELNLATGAVTTLYSFKGGSDGARPVGPLYVDANGNVFGTTALGGGGSCTPGCGTVFEMSASKSYAEMVLYAFKGGNDGWQPQGGVVASNGDLFGTTLYGGNSGNCSNGCGTIFRLVSARGYTEKIVHAINGAGEGAYITSPAYLDTSGNIYVAAENGGNKSCTVQGGEKGAQGCGVILELEQNGSGSYRAVIVHTFAGGADGALPNGAIVAFGGALFGTTLHGGGGANCGYAGSGCGTVFSIASSTGYQVQRRFGPVTSHAARDPLVFLNTATNELDGTLANGGRYGYGDIYRSAP